MLVLVGFVSMSSFAGDCLVTVNRTACPGKETDALKPYNGKNPTEIKKHAKDEAACAEMAVKEAKIIRRKTLAEKRVTATFEGREVAPASDKKPCQ